MQRASACRQFEAVISALHPLPPLFPLSYLQSSISKTFQRCVIDSLEEPEMVSTMLLPGQNHSLE